MRQSVLVDSAIWVIDDRAENVEALSEILRAHGCTKVTGYTRAAEAMADLRLGNPLDLILLDLHMPEMNGIEVLEHLRRVVPDEEFLPVIVLTGDTGPDLRDAALELGAMDYILKPIRAKEVLLRTGNLLRTRQLHQEVLGHAKTLTQRVAERTQQLEDAYLDTITRLARAAEFRDDTTGQHIRRVGFTAERVTIAAGLGPEFGTRMRYAAQLHDIGKIGIPDSILMKPGRLTEVEREAMKKHAEIGARILEGSRSKLLDLAAEIALTHHERWDGAGYPRGLKGEAIPVSGRIAAIADVFDALTNERPYKRAWSMDEAIEEMSRCGGTHFDPEIVGAFIAVVSQIRRGPGDTEERNGVPVE